MEQLLAVWLVITIIATTVFLIAYIVDRAIDERNEIKNPRVYVLSCLFWPIAILYCIGRILIKNK